MGKLLHHLSALGWGWVALFLVLDVIAVVCAAVALRHRERRSAIKALFVSTAAALASVAATVFVVAAGIASAQSGLRTSEPSQSAKELATGISVATNGAAFGTVFTLIAGLAALLCLVATILSGKVADERAATAAAEPGGKHD